VNPHSTARKRVKNINALRAQRIAKENYERYTIHGIIERIKREKLTILKSTTPPFNGYQEYFLTGSNGVLRSMELRVRKKDNAISMWMPKHIQGKGYTTALYVAISRLFKKPIIISSNTTRTIFDDNGNIVKQGGVYTWEELKKKQGKYIKSQEKLILMRTEKIFAQHKRFMLRFI